jgi:hypothetical protein
MTVIQVPRTFLESMDEDERRSFLDQGDWQTDTAEMKTLTYLEERGRRAVEPVVAACVPEASSLTSPSWKAPTRSMPS